MVFMEYYKLESMNPAWMVLSRCGRHACVNPLHLYVQSPPEKAKPRKKHPRSITDEEVATIRKRAEEGLYTQAEVAKEIGRTVSTVSRHIQKLGIEWVDQSSRRRAK